MGSERSVRQNASPWATTVWQGRNCIFVQLPADVWRERRTAEGQQEAQKEAQKTATL
jgi:hypothetical protein